jgi:hypothetical protein
MTPGIYKWSQKFATKTYLKRYRKHLRNQTRKYRYNDNVEHIGDVPDFDYDCYGYDDGWCGDH